MSKNNGHPPTKKETTIERMKKVVDRMKELKGRSVENRNESEELLRSVQSRPAQSRS